MYRTMNEAKDTVCARLSRSIFFDSPRILLDPFHMEPSSVEMRWQYSITKE